MNPDTFTYQQKKYALGEINTIKENICGKIKGHTCVDGRL